MKNNLERITMELRCYFDMFEAIQYSFEINIKTGNTYRHDARRTFVKHYLENKNFAELYILEKK